jgi:hypothetical protein
MFQLSLAIQTRTQTMKTRKFLPFLLVALLIGSLLQACAGSSQSHSSSSSNLTANSDFTDETQVAVKEMEIKPDMTSNYLDIKSLNLSSGELSLRLYNPEGELQWEEAFSVPERYQQVYKLDTTPGIWQLEIELEDASGSYRIEWQGSN